MKWLKKLFKKENIFDAAPFLSPWYFSENTPSIVREGQVLNWKKKGSLMILKRGVAFFGIIDTYTYIIPSEKGDYFLIWNEPERIDDETIRLTLKIYKSDALNAFEGNIDNIISSYRKQNYSYSKFNCEPIAEATVFLSGKYLETKNQLPDAFKKFNSFITVVNVPALYTNPITEWASCALVEINTQTGDIAIYPQDWFNKSNLDFGYQWITRAVRHNNQIKLQGIRLPENMILDNTNRQLITPTPA